MAAFNTFRTDTKSPVFAYAVRKTFLTFQPSIVAVGVAIPSRIEGASPMYKINAAAKVPFKAVDSSGNGLTGLTITAKTGKDGANPTTTTNGVSESGQGWYYITLTSTEMNGEIIVLDLSASGATIAPIAIHTEADYTATRAVNLDNLNATISSRSTYSGGAVTLSSAYDAAKTAAQAGDAMTLTSGERTTLAASIWNALTSGLTTAGSIGKRIIDYLTGDAFARLGATTGASVSADIAAVQSSINGISVATNAGDLTTKQADSSVLVTGTNISGSYSNTGTNDTVYWITAPVTPAVSGFGLRQRLEFDLPLGRTPVGIQVRGYFNGSGQAVDIYALNDRTGAYDKLTNASTDLASRNSDALYAIPLPRDYADDSGGVYNIVTLEFRSTSVNTAHRLRIDQILVAHVAEDVATTSTAPTAEQIWSYVKRELTTPGAEPVTVPTAAEIRAEIDANSTQLAAVKGKTDNLPSDPADASAIAGSFSTVNTTLATIAGYVDNEVALIKAKTDLIPASPAAVSDIPSAATVAADVLAALNATTGTRTLGQHLQAQSAVLAGETTGAGTGHIVFTDGAVTVEADVPLPGVVGDRQNVTISGV